MRYKNFLAMLFNEIKCHINASLAVAIRGPFPPRFLLGLLLASPSFFLKAPVQVRLVDIYSR